MRAAQEELAIQRQSADDNQKLADQKLKEAAAHKTDLDTAVAQEQNLADQIDQRLDQRLGEAAALQAQDAALSAQIAAQDALLAALRARANSGGGARGPGAVSPPSGHLGVVNAFPGTITVDSGIAGNLQDMVNAAHGAGVDLGGSGFRDSASQIALHGTSMHEKGLAIDFTCDGGGTISSHSSPCWQWLNGNASSFGFFNLPSEPWHWSTTGN
jgi:LAS superfamily LD-carboxypeptidase LdcB